MKQHINSLDGVRGGLALWVFWGHLAGIVGFKMPFLTSPGLAVDLFMLLSGFLMSWHWDLNRQRATKPGFFAQSKEFWLRRWFRIAPLYYIVLFFAVLLNPQITSARIALLNTFRSQLLENLNIAENVPPIFFSNILSHLTFIFGLLPNSSLSHALPDWSISLEMQFYLIFPFLMLFCRPTLIYAMSIAAIIIALLSSKLFGVAPNTIALVAVYQQPSLILLKIHIFVAGIALGWLAANRSVGNSRSHYWIAFMLPILFLPKIVSLISVVICALILIESGPARVAARILSTLPFRVAGDLSYGVYLMHLFPTFLFLNLAVRHGMFIKQSGIWRFFLAAVILTPIVYALSYALHVAIEKPGITFGKKLARRMIAT